MAWNMSKYILNYAQIVKDKALKYPVNWNMHNNLTEILIKTSS